MRCTVDPTKLKRQRDRERYSETKDEINKRRGEAYKLKKMTATDGTHTQLAGPPGNESQTSSFTASIARE